MAVSKDREYEVVDKAFNVTLLLKAIFAASEILGAIGLLFLTPERLRGLVGFVTGGRTTGLLIGHLADFAAHFTTSSQWLAAFYLFSHGAVKLIVIYFLWRRVMWAYPISIAVLVGFIAYQSWEMVARGSVLMGLATLIDLAVIVLTVLEYRRMRGKW